MMVSLAGSAEYRIHDTANSEIIMTTVTNVMMAVMAEKFSDLSPTRFLASSGGDN